MKNYYYECTNETELRNFLNYLETKDKHRWVNGSRPSSENVIEGITKRFPKRFPKQTVYLFIDAKDHRLSYIAGRPSDWLKYIDRHKYPPFPYNPNPYNF